MTAPVLELAVRAPLASFDLDIAFTSERRVLGVFGPSGAGKTSLLETIAGLRRAATGRIACRGRVWLDSAAGIRVPTERRGIGYVPQDHLLFPHWNVSRNLRSGVARSRQPADRAEAVFDEVVRILELDSLLDRPVDALSGGERQRVSLGRALCSGPDLLMLDEPMASLDLKLRRQILPFLLRARESFAVPMLVVSHSPLELQALCDEVIALDQGRLVAQGEPTSVFARSDVYASAAGEGFENLLGGRVEASEAGATAIRLGSFEAGPRILAGSSERAVGERALIGIRAQDLLVSRSRVDGTSARNWLEATVKALSQAEGRRVLTASIEPHGCGEVVVELTGEAVEELDLRVGERIWLFFKSTAVAVY